MDATNQPKSSQQQPVAATQLFMHLVFIIIIIYFSIFVVLHFAGGETETDCWIKMRESLRVVEQAEDSS